MNDRQLGERLRRAFEAEQPPAISAAEILQRAEATQSKGHHADLQDRELPRTHVGRPALTPTGGQQALGAVAFDREERQRRELEEIRRSFTEIGTRMGSLFEPAQESQQRTPEPAEPTRPAVEAAPARRRAVHWVLAAAAVLALVCLLVGGGLGYLLHRPAGVSAQPPTTIVVTSTVPEAKLAAPSACLETARRADVVVDLLIRNIRDRRLSLALQAYTEASQACRKQASP